jgi:hypothetical protein
MYVLLLIFGACEVFEMNAYTCNAMYNYLYPTNLIGINNSEQVDEVLYCASHTMISYILYNVSIQLISIHTILVGDKHINNLLNHYDISNQITYQTSMILIYIITY